ncbi:hypothetical protein G647_03026 [Cladophialophora carrionii CBS 160.54]|uniref:T6SS Phospholipase effector Tle1-like catalytic domain-containing protein n=1 Tax=Cladophialophora carrionii CBS 160.54 TaxID=1279043 RepID=V9DH80_9EURO|nr:uncharacterized protein G647_03026 [Cladophialophora carrionii CBS 160.54]ETI26249.1 hypothetical protein G647_03026 [Cladophialophora carrionii CBS 160.54]
MNRSPANYKRLIVLCDGTWQSILNVNTPSQPSNVARFARAISPVAIVDGKEVEQIIYYQPGVGTGLGDQIRGGVYGAGLSANIRAAYAFLAHNYDSNGPDPNVKGDEIFFFGFSRGAYTARSIAGLVTKLGLLTKRGMDWFPQVYDEYYEDAGKKPDFHFSAALKARIGTDMTEKAKYAIKVVGVWDTVEFHGEGWGGEQIEFHNAELSTKVAYAYHALSLDERRVAYRPTLWQWPRDPADRSKPYQPNSRAAAAGAGLQVMKQAWFSGVHSDVGGGRYDPGGSDITLAWMLAQCAKDKKLAFIDETDSPQDCYLLREQDKGVPNPNTAWTRLRKPFDPEPKEGGGLFDTLKTGVQEILMDDRRAWPVENTNEKIHRSIRDRDLTKWPCGMLDGSSETVPGKSDKKQWHLKRGTKWGGKSYNHLPELEDDPEADAIEDKYRGRIRAVPGSKGGPSSKL